MCSFTEMVRREGIREGIREGKIEGKREGKIEGKREGKIEGKREGKIEGKREGKIEGKKEGIEESQLLFFSNLKKAGIDDNTICSYMSITMRRLAKLRKLLAATANPEPQTV